MKQKMKTTARDVGPPPSQPSPTAAKHFVPYHSPPNRDCVVALQHGHRQRLRLTVPTHSHIHAEVRNEIRPKQPQIANELIQVRPSHVVDQVHT